MNRMTLLFRARILVQVTIYRRLRIGRDGHLEQSKAYDISQLVREYGPRHRIRNLNPDSLMLSNVRAGHRGSTKHF